jgi:hypothetical protein
VRRRLFTVLTDLSPLLCVAVVALWARSDRWSDTLRSIDSSALRETARYASVGRGVFRFHRVITQFRVRPGSPLEASPLTWYRTQWSEDSAEDSDFANQVLMRKHGGQEWKGFGWARSKTTFSPRWNEAE